MTNDFFDKTKGGLIVSCQALPDEPLFGAEIMAKMALAAVLGGAVGIRANTVIDITAIKNTVNIPLIGIIKKVYDDSDVYITPTDKEVYELVECGVDVVAIDATNRLRPNQKELCDWFSNIRKNFPNQLFMADCSNYDECIQAEKIGFDIVGTTLSGYTEYTKNRKVPDFELLEKISCEIKVPIIAEGGIHSPEQLSKVLSIKGVHVAVVGGAITRPLEITKRFIKAIK